jgi:hypothetical protein
MQIKRGEMGKKLVSRKQSGKTNKQIRIKIKL